MAKIQEKNRKYFLLKYYVDRLFKLAYRRVEYHGKEKLPQDGAIIFAPNHTNTLMDALVVLALDREAKVFVARADLFKHPTLLKFLTFLKMMPINRKRDGLDTLAKNVEINNIVVDVLHDKTPFCIMPEGTHTTKYSLLPLQKGIFRIALQANDTFGSEMPVYIVPFGITYGNFFRYRSSMLALTGEPFNITQFLREHPEYTLPQQQINALRVELAGRMKKVMLHIPDDDNYNATIQLVQLYGNEQQRRLGLSGNSLINRFKASKETVANVAALLQSNPVETQELLSMAEAFSRQRHALGIGMKSALKPHIRLSLIGETVLLILGLPYFIFSAVVTSPVTVPYAWLSAKFKYRAFHNTVQFLIAMVLLPVLLLLPAIVVAIVCPWIWALVYAVLFIPAFICFYDYIRLARSTVSDIKWLINRELREKIESIKNRFTNMLK